jgi:hypothetical protein
MTHKLEELFNLPDVVVTNNTQEIPESVFSNQAALASANDIIDRIDAALPQVDLDGADRELDELSDLARDKFNDLMDLGMNVEARFSGTILQTAGMLLGHAIAAKQVKIDKKLKMIDLQLKKMKLDQTAAKDAGSNAIEGQATVIDRNELLSKILNASKEANSKK